jgi:hypothetical protein
VGNPVEGIAAIVRDELQATGKLSPGAEAIALGPVLFALGQEAKQEIVGAFADHPHCSDEERETLIAEARKEVDRAAESATPNQAERIRAGQADDTRLALIVGLTGALYNAHRTLEFDKHHMDDLAAALASQRPVWEVQVEALEQAVADCPDMSGFTRAWFRERAAELRRSGALAHSHAPDTGMWAGCQACTAGGGG